MLSCGLAMNRDHVQKKFQASLEQTCVRCQQVPQIRFMSSAPVDTGVCAKVYLLRNHTLLQLHAYRVHCLVTFQHVLYMFGRRRVCQSYA